MTQLIISFTLSKDQEWLVVWMDLFKGGHNNTIRHTLKHGTPIYDNCFD